jgi:hypothetical protein
VHASIRENILFGNAFDASRYKEVIRVCCLEPDLEQFADGDATGALCPAGSRHV